MSVLSLIHKPLSDDDLRRILGARLKIVKYSYLDTLDDLNQLLPQPLDCCIVLYEQVPNVGHWTALCKYSGLFEHFDSYGGKPDAPLRWVNLKMRYRLNQATPHLSELLERQPSIYNTVKFQSDEHSVNTCGSHVAHRLFRLRNQNMNLQQYQDYMKELKKETQTSYDYLVAACVKSELG
jgi:hypothetical protein